MKYKGIVIITGVGVRQVVKMFNSTSKADLIRYAGKLYKINAAAGSAVVLNKAGYIVYMIGASEEKLAVVSSVLKGEFYAEVMDLTSEETVKRLKSKVEKIQKKHKTDLHLVHYGSASDTKVALPGDTVFIGPMDSPPQAAADLIAANIVPWLNLIQVFMPIFNRQKITKIIVISAVAVTRVLPRATLDNVQKGAVHAMARSLAVDLTKDRIYVTEIMPGYTDTGFYDGDLTLKNTLHQLNEFNYKYDDDSLPVFSGQKVGEAVKYSLMSDTHVREISLVPYGQMPHLGA